MQNLKYKALSIAMAVMTAASPVLSSYTALLCINLTGTVMRAGYCRKEQWNQAKRMNRQHCGK